MRRSIVLPCLGLLALGTALADNFTFTYTGGTYSANGVLVANANGDGSFTAISGMGTFDGTAINLVANPNGTSVDSVNLGSLNYTYDDQLFPGASFTLDGSGLLFHFMSARSDGSTYVNICGSPSCTYNTTSLTPYGSILNIPSPPAIDSGTFVLTDVPEPSSLAALGLVLLGLATLKLRKPGLSPMR